MEVDGYHSEKSELKIYDAYKGNVKASLECHGIISNLLRVHDHTNIYTLKLGLPEIICIHKVLGNFIKESGYLEEK